MKYCQKCGTKIAVGEKFCSSCGEPLDEEIKETKEVKGNKYCKSCGKKVDDNIKFCSSCGASTDDVLIVSDDKDQIVVGAQHDSALVFHDDLNVLSGLQRMEIRIDPLCFGFNRQFVWLKFFK